MENMENMHQQQHEIKQQQTQKQNKIAINKKIFCNEL
jgi:hypothetical protein